MYQSVRSLFYFLPHQLFALLNNAVGLLVIMLTLVMSSQTATAASCPARNVNASNAAQYAYHFAEINAGTCTRRVAIPSNGVRVFSSWRDCAVGRFTAVGENSGGILPISLTCDNCTTLNRRDGKVAPGTSANFRAYFKLSSGTVDVRYDGTFTRSADSSSCSLSGSIVGASFGGDATRPTASIEALTGPVAGVYSAVITLSESSTDFTVDDLTLVNATAALSGSGANYTVELTPSVSGLTSVAVPKGSFSDAAGNTNAAKSNIVSRGGVTVTAQAISSVIAEGKLSVHTPEELQVSAFEDGQPITPLAYLAEGACETEVPDDYLSSCMPVPQEGLMSGTHRLWWVAAGAGGLRGESIQTVNILPTVQFASHVTMVGSAGNTLETELVLSGPLPASLVQISVPYTVSGSAVNPTDHFLAAGSFVIQQDKANSEPLAITLSGAPTIGKTIVITLDTSAAVFALEDAPIDPTIQFVSSGNPVHQTITLSGSPANISTVNNGGSGGGSMSWLMLVVFALYSLRSRVMVMKAITTIFTLLVFVPAQGGPRNGLLLSLGQTNQSSNEIHTGLEALGYSGINVVDDTSRRTWSLGYRYLMRQQWSLDMQYLQQGKTQPTVALTLVPGKNNVQAAQDTTQSMPQRGQGISAITLYHYPLTKKLALQMGGGAFFWRSERIAIVSNSSHTRKDNGVSPMLQLGLSYPLSSRVRVEGQWQYTRMPDEAVKRIGLGLAFDF